MRGRKAQPAAVKEAKGNPGRRRIAAEAADGSRVASDRAPRELDPAGVAIWQSIAPELARTNILKATDEPAFARYCRDLARYWQVTKILKKEREVYWTESKHGKLQRLNPWFVVQERLARRLEAAEDRFGLTPSARQSIMMRAAAKTADLPFTAPSDTPPPADQPLPGPLGMLRTPGRVH